MKESKIIKDPQKFLLWSQNYLKKIIKKILNFK